MEQHEQQKPTPRKLDEMTAKQLLRNIRHHGWDWSFNDFCKAIGKAEAINKKDVWVQEMWENFQKLYQSLSRVCDEFLEKLAQP